MMSYYEQRDSPLLGQERQARSTARLLTGQSGSYYQVQFDSMTAQDATDEVPAWRWCWRYERGIRR